MNAFELLGLETRLTITPDALRDAFHQAGKSAHPDAGGDEREFARLREAHTMLASPSRRLRHWLELHGIDADTRGPVNPRVMDLFSPVGEVSQCAETLVRRREDARTSLGRALLEKETQHCREEVERMIATLESAIAAECAVFPGIEALETTDPAAASSTARNLAFLEKWQTSLRSLYARLA